MLLFLFIADGKNLFFAWKQKKVIIINKINHETPI
jgi:hypothetical protein